MNEEAAIWRRPLESGPRTPLVVFFASDEHQFVSMFDSLPPANVRIAPGSVSGSARMVAI